ncbi:AAA family ATPase [Candidatus Gracilibacteria bacterium]|nr:AAA family ATPase [Candidatus Gracilibacteria bacterium]MCF7898430.1 AAA family ATPase [Candidatus Paceibacterota bacterium]
MRLSHITIQGFKSFAKKTTIDVTHQVTGVVGPNGSGKSNIAEAIRFVLGEQSMKSMRGKIGSDVIFKGSEHLSPMSRASVTMVIDNKNKKGGDDRTIEASPELAPYLVYDELTLSRVIYADGTSDYLLNDAKIRLKDVQELLSFAGIGGSAHTIINQGEADRILLASPKDRKEALEDALGLRVYHMRLNESKRKLERVKNHVREVELLRTEIKPHLIHLERQVKKIESQEEERKNLHRLLTAYLTREEHELNLLNERIHEQGTSSTLILITDSIHKELHVLKEKTHDIQSVSVQEKHTFQAELRSLSERKDQITKTLGRLEAEKSYLEKELNKEDEKKSVTISHNDFNQTHHTISSGFKEISNHLSTNNINSAESSIKELSQKTELFFTTHSTKKVSNKEQIKSDIVTITETIREHEEKEKTLTNEIIFLQGKIDQVDTKAQARITSRHEEEKKIMLLESKLRELDSTIALRRQEEGELALRRQHFEALIQEGVMIVGRVVLEYKNHVPEERYKDTPKHDLMRAIERSKLRIEEAGVPNRDEVIAEYKTTRERDEYLVKELADIKESEEKLLELINELEVSLKDRFSTGVTEVSKVFSEFFGEVFVGGKGKLTLVHFTKVDDEGNEITETGIDIDVSLPNKKVKEINMFSGGERALVSIALLFAMSSITPPPFMVLDETDAPLDESNARKYGVMLQRLAENSKLLVITHNRETMNHCDMLYGVTIGVDGGSKLLSIDFKQAESLVK